MIYGSVCSGIEAATVAWHPLGWEPAFFSEIEAFPRAVLQHHYPDTPCHGDFTTIEPGQYAAIDLLVGGTPCQDFSVAGLRAGLAGDRGRLTIEFCRLAGRLRPRWLVWENVPGVLSADDGNAFGIFLGALAELGYGTAYRVLDAQYAGVPQRRRRVFVVGYLGDWRRAAGVLFERESLSGHPAPSRRSRSVVTSLTASGAGTERPGGKRKESLLIPIWMGQGLAEETDVSTTLDSRAKDGPRRNQMATAVYVAGHSTYREGIGTLRANGGDVGDGSETLIALSNTAGDTALSVGAVAPPLRAGCTRGGAVTPEIAHSLRAEGFDASEDGTGRGTPIIPCSSSAVRRLTPRECERLQGFPDDYTLVPYRNKPAADGPRYKALGNSMAVPCMRWIGERIAMVEQILQENESAA